MRSPKQLILIFTAFVILSVGCEDQYGGYSDWAKQNTSYFNSMKDSTGFVNYIIPNSGGLSYYYKVLKQGNTDSLSPSPTAYVKVNYRGALITGTVFDQTYSKKSVLNDSTAKPVSFNLQSLIIGWQLNLIQMKPGEIRTIVLPQELGYGSYTMSVIPPYSTLRFDIQLISSKN